MTRHTVASTLALAAALAVACSVTGCNGQAPNRQTVMLGGQSFELELALTPQTRQTGLMHRDSLPDNGGMLFVFMDEAVRRFWMKNCLIPLDALFLDEQGRIVRIRTMSVPTPDTPDRQLPTYSSVYPARFVIELAAGRAEQLGLTEGDVIDLPADKLKAWAR